MNISSTLQLLLFSFLSNFGILYSQDDKEKEIVTLLLSDKKGSVTQGEFRDLGLDNSNFKLKCIASRKAFSRKVIYTNSQVYKFDSKEITYLVSDTVFFKGPIIKVESDYNKSSSDGTLLKKFDITFLVDYHYVWQLSKVKGKYVKFVEYRYKMNKDQVGTDKPKKTRYYIFEVIE